jgi:hypothetical protein
VLFLGKAKTSTCEFFCGYDAVLFQIATVRWQGPFATLPLLAVVYVLAFVNLRVI